MQITEIKVFPVREDKLKAFVSIVLDECFMVNDIKVINGKEGFFISMPSRRKRNGKFKDVAHPLNNETRRLMEERILAAYEEALAEAPPEERAAGTSRRRGRRRRRPAAEGSEPSREPRGRRSPGREESKPEDRSRRAVERGSETRPEIKPEPRRETKDPAGPESPQSEKQTGEQSLDEVAEHHLRDSFWGT